MPRAFWASKPHEMYPKYMQYACWFFISINDSIFAQKQKKIFCKSHPTYSYDLWLLFWPEQITDFVIHSHLPHSNYQIKIKTNKKCSYETKMIFDSKCTFLNYLSRDCIQNRSTSKDFQTQKKQKGIWYFSSCWINNDIHQIMFKILNTSLLIRMTIVNAR